MINYRNPVIDFDSNDRCDRCGARAYAVYNLGDLELFFCGHHIRQHNVALESDGWVATYDFEGLERLVNREEAFV